MPKLAANLTTMYTEYPFLERFAAAAADGFTAVEYLFPYAFPGSALRAQLVNHGLTQVLFNAPPGNWDAGDRGIAALPGREAEFRSTMALALTYAQELACPRVHVMAGIPGPHLGGQRQSDVSATYLSNLEHAASTAADMGLDVLIEPINQRDMPGYALSQQADAHWIVQEVGAPNLKVQLDLYHCQISEGDLTAVLRRDIPTGRVGHVQIAGVPLRHEPDHGELNIRYLLEQLDEVGYTGWIGCEYRPRGATSDGLGWARHVLKGQHPQ